MFAFIAAPAGELLKRSFMPLSWDGNILVYSMAVGLNGVAIKIIQSLISVIRTRDKDEPVSSNKTISRFYETKPHHFQQTQGLGYPA